MKTITLAHHTTGEVISEQPCTPTALSALVACLWSSEESQYSVKRLQYTLAEHGELVIGKFKISI